MYPLIKPPAHRGGDNKPTDFSVSEMIFDGDHDFFFAFEVYYINRSQIPNSSPLYVLRNLSRHLGTPRSRSDVSESRFLFLAPVAIYFIRTY